MGHVRFALSCLLLVSLAVSAQDADQQAELPAMVPADMGPGPDPWNGLIRFPKGKEDVNVFIKCQGVITINGRVHDSMCVTDDPNHWQYTTALDRVLGTARVHPAVVDGRARQVLTVFSFLFVRKQQEEKIALFQNDMTSKDALGFTYVAPQLYYNPVSNCGVCGPNRRYFQRYTVHVDGTGAITLPPGYDRCQVCWDTYAEGLKFIPGHLNGKPVEASMQILGEP
jgi:hypothetical protein